MVKKQKAWLEKLSWLGIKAHQQEVWELLLKNLYILLSRYLRFFE